MKEYRLIDLTSSRIQYDKNPPKFIMWIFFIISLFICSIIILACFTYKTEVVKTTSTIQSTNRTSVQSPTQGQIMELHISNGEYVTKDDLLFVLDTTQIDSSITSLEAKCSFIQEYINKYNDMISVLNTMNPETLEGLYNPFTEGQFYYDFKNVIKQINDVVASENIQLVDARKSIIEQYLSSYYNALFQYEYELIGNQSQVEGYKKIKQTYYVYAPTSGYVNYTSKISNNNVIDNSVILTISEKLNLDNAMIESYISSEYRSFISVGNDVEISIAGLSQSKYGFLTGEVVDISEDALIDEENNVLYKVSIKPNSIELLKNDEKIELVNGQICEIRIKYESVSWMTWALTKIGILK